MQETNSRVSLAATITFSLVRMSQTFPEFDVNVGGCVYDVNLNVALFSSHWEKSGVGAAGEGVSWYADT